MGAEDVDLHRPFVVGAAEERHRLLLAVSVEIDHLHALQVAARGRRGILCAAGELRVDQRLQRLILRRQLRQTVERLVGGAGHTARKQQHHTQQRAKQPISRFFRHVSPPPRHSNAKERHSRSFPLVPVTELEPVRCRQRWILSFVILPEPISKHRKLAETFWAKSKPSS